MPSLHILRLSYNSIVGGNEMTKSPPSANQAILFSFEAAVDVA